MKLQVEVIGLTGVILFVLGCVGVVGGAVSTFVMVFAALWDFGLGTDISVLWFAATVTAIIAGIGLWALGIMCSHVAAFMEKTP